jgi:hypothetical protein
MYLGRNVKEYEDIAEQIIDCQIRNGNIRCELCVRQMSRHSYYERSLKESGKKINITLAWCRPCKKWHALLPDFILAHKHYSGNEIESVIIDSSDTANVKYINTKASEVTVRRWIKQIGDRITQAVSVLKYIFGRAGRTINEAAVTPGSSYSELEQVLEMSPSSVKYSGNKLGLANLWLGTNAIKAYI